MDNWAAKGPARPFSHKMMELPHLPSLSHDFHEIIGEIASGQIETQDGVRKGVTLVDGDGVGDTIANVEDETSCAARSVEGKDSLNTDIPMEKVYDECLCMFIHVCIFIPIYNL